MNAVAEKIYQTVLDEIAEHKLNGGDRLPTETVLAKRFKTNRMNAHYAVKQLESNGLVNRQKRRGTFLKEDISHDSLTALRNHVSGVTRLVMSRRLSPGPYVHWDDNTISELELTLDDANHKVFFSEMPVNRIELEEMLANFVANGSRSVVFFPLHEDWDLLQANIDLFKSCSSEIFIMNRGSRPPFEFPCHVLSLDPFGEGMAAGELVVEQKLEQSVFVSTESEGQPYWVQQRIRGVQSALDGRVSFQVATISDVDAAESIFSEFALTPRTAVIAQTDRVASWLADTALALGLVPGEDFKLIGFDNDDRFRKYNLTTLAPPTQKIARTLADMIITDQWHKTDGVYALIKLSSRLIRRETA